MEEHYNIQDVMNKCTHFISSEVRFTDVRSRMKPIFSPIAFEGVEGGTNSTNREIMVRLCKSACSLSIPDFKHFVATLNEDYSHVSNHINEEYFKKTGQYLLNLQQHTRSQIDESPDPPASRPCSSEEQSRENVHSEELLASVASTTSTQVAEQTASGASYHEVIPVSCPSYRKTAATAKNESLLTAGIENESNVHSSAAAVPGETMSSPSEPVDDKYQKQKSLKAVYNMDSIPRGCCLIICNENFTNFRKRNGSKADVKILYEMFAYLSFEIQMHENKTATEMKWLLKEFANLPALKGTSSLAVVILSHGSKDDLMFGTDGSLKNKIPVEGTFIKKFDLQQTFDRTHCPSMSGKPKLFIIQACRGDMEDLVEDEAQQHVPEIHHDSIDVLSHDAPEALSPATARAESQPKTTDMIFLHSSSLGYKAYRMSESGSPFLQKLTEAVKEYAHDTHLKDIFEKLQVFFSENKLSDRMTTPDYSSTLLKKWYLNPPLQKEIKNQEHQPALSSNTKSSASPRMKKYDLKMQENPSQVYKMDSFPRGCCVIISNVEFLNLGSRHGSEIDSLYLDKMFNFLGFQVLHYKNKTAKEMRSILNEFASSQELEKVSALAVAILSHGSENDIIIGTDGTCLSKLDIQEIFKGRRCQSMAGKPKLFILNASRGSRITDHHSSGSHMKPIYAAPARTGIVNMDFPPPSFPEHRNVPSIYSDHPEGSQSYLQQVTPPRSDVADMCFLYPTSPGYETYRNVKTGSHFLKYFTEIVVQYAHEKSLEAIFREVQNHFSSTLIGERFMVMPEFSSYLTKKWYLNPPEEHL